MKKYIPFFLIASLLLSACSIDWNDEKDKKIAELEKQTQATIFEKQKECSKFEKEMMEHLMSTSVVSKDDTVYIDAIFYSPERNSCLYRSDVISSKFWSVFDELKITDFFTKEVIFSKLCNRGSEDFSSCSDTYEAKTKELRWK